MGNESHHPGSLAGFPGLFFVIALLAGICSCSSKPIEEVVTTDANRSSALPAGAEPVAIAPTLPERDENVEAAGDRIAEAITYLNSHRREAAVRALGQAEAAMNNALRVRAEEDQARTALKSVLKDLNAAQRTVQRGTSDSVAARQLTALNRSLDNIDLRPSTPLPEASSPSPQA
jgi:hypothetical protein